MLPATADVADCPEVRGIWDKYDAWCDSMNVPRANHGIVTVYSDGSMNIDYHYDKMKTIAESFSIQDLSVQLGDHRVIGKAMSWRKGDAMHRN